ncbi:PQQ-dependent sugar dehydrogenase [Methyloceanibacter sp.]|uniref:PQQ-dependent sugar dehydrogenase n=1 Tax=Methyloceanibacter sp. TaxID=1965321 RepID=UPI0035625D21
MGTDFEAEERSVMGHKLTVIVAAAVSFAASTAATADTRLSRGFVPVQEGVEITEVLGGLEFPWGLTALPDGTLLITQRDGAIRIVKDGTLSDTEISFPVEVMTERSGPDGNIVRGQGGLLDIAASPNFADDKLLFFTYATGKLDANRTAIGRAVWTGDGLDDFKQIFQVSKAKRDGQHFGSRLAFMGDDTLLATIGDGGNPPLEFLDTLQREQAQNLQSYFGSVIRIKPDGSVPDGNPFAELAGAKPEVWSFGHRNAQGIVVDPKSGAVWVSEHGPLGGDELNRVEKGANYGWPRVTFGRDYRDGSVITPNIAGLNFEAPALAWVDTHAPSGLLLYSGSAFPDWKGNLLSTGLASRDIRRIEIEDGKVVGQTRIPVGTTRMRDLEIGTDGTLYAVTDGAEGTLLRIEPAP